MEIVIIGIISAIAIFVLQELASYILNKFFEGADRKIPSIINKNKERRAKEFHDVIKTKDYKDFEKAYLRSYYGDEFFTDTKYGKIPVFSTSYAYSNINESEDIRYYDSLALNSKGSFAFDPSNHQDYRKYGTSKSIIKLLVPISKIPIDQDLC